MRPPVRCLTTRASLLAGSDEIRAQRRHGASEATKKQGRRWCLKIKPKRLRDVNIPLGMNWCHGMMDSIGTHGDRGYITSILGEICVCVCVCLNSGPKLAAPLNTSKCNHIGQYCMFSLAIEPSNSYNLQVSFGTSPDERECSISMADAKDKGKQAPLQTPPWKSIV